MEPVTVTSLISLGTTLIQKLWPDPQKQAEELRKLKELEQKGDLALLEAHVQLMLGQIKTNQEAAKHRSLLVAGARPFIIWVCGFSLAWTGLIHPMLMWAWAFAGIEGNPPPMIESEALTTILLGLLGLGTMRSVDKFNKVETNSIGK